MSLCCFPNNHLIHDYQKLKFLIIYNLRFDPFESFDGVTDRSDALQRKQWLNEPIQELLMVHIKSLSDYPPVQKAATLDFSELVKEMQSGQQ